MYPVYLDNNGLIDLTIDIANTPPQGVYNPNGYTLGDFQNAETAFSDAESFNVDILVAPSLDLNGMSQIAETRHDCLAIVAPYDYRALVGKSNTQATQYMIDKFGTTSNEPNMLFDTFGTYTKIVANMKYQYDKYNDVNRWMCLAGDIAGLYAQTDANFDPWWAADGLTRGKILNVIKLAFNPNKQNRDALYVNALNPVINIAGIEYDAGCWQSRFVIQRVQTATANANYAMFFQLELGGMASIGSNPLQLINRNIPGYKSSGLLPDNYRQLYNE